MKSSVTKYRLEFFKQSRSIQYHICNNTDLWKGNSVTNPMENNSILQLSLHDRNEDNKGTVPITFPISLICLSASETWDRAYRYKAAKWDREQWTLCFWLHSLIFRFVETFSSPMQIGQTASESELNCVISYHAFMKVFRPLDIFYIVTLQPYCKMY